MSTTKTKKLTRLEENHKKWLADCLKYKVEDIVKTQEKLIEKDKSFYAPAFRTPVLDKRFELTGLNYYHKGDFWISVPMLVREFQGLPVNIFSLHKFNTNKTLIINLVTFKSLVIEVDCMTDVHERGNVKLCDERFTRKVKTIDHLKELLGLNIT